MKPCRRPEDLQKMQIRVDYITHALVFFTLARVLELIAEALQLAFDPPARV